MRRLAVVAVLVLTPLPALPAFAGPLPSPGPPRLLWTFGAQTRPTGVLARADLLTSRTTLALGAHVAYRTVSMEFGVGPSVYLLGGFLTFTVRATVEPGFYLTVPPGATLARGRALDDPSDRRAGLHYGGSALLGLNVRTGRLWLYNRDAGWVRARLEPEYDRVSDAVVDAELGLEVATAVMVDLWPTTTTRHLWLYGEYTHDWIAGAGTVIARPSAGLIAEEFLPRVAFDLDFNYGLREGPLQGFGVIAAVWIAAE